MKVTLLYDYVEQHYKQQRLLIKTFSVKTSCISELKYNLATER